MVLQDQMLEDRAAMGPQYQALVGDPQGDGGDADQQPQSASQSASQHAKREEPRGNDKDDRDDDNQENAVDPPIHLKLPLQLDFDELAGVSAPIGEMALNARVGGESGLVTVTPSCPARP